MKDVSHVHTLGVCNLGSWVGTVCVRCRASVETCACEGVRHE